jgi:hypothetical protein
MFRDLRHAAESHPLAQGKGPGHEARLDQISEAAVLGGGRCSATTSGIFNAAGHKIDPIPQVMQRFLSVDNVANAVDSGLARQPEDSRTTGAPD